MRWCGDGAPGSRVVELDGVAGAIVPAVPSRSIANSVTYRDADALIASLDELAATYEEAGIEAWTVWAPEFDREAIAGLEAAGHKFDGQPTAMVLDLAAAAPSDLGDLEWDREATWEELGRINDEAYGHAGAGGFAPGLRRFPEGLDLRLRRARVDGETTCVMATIDHAPTPGADGPDCGVYFVATREAFRRRGLATRLMWAALGEARERGCATSSLQASAMGEPVYAAMGYEPCFRFHMYERRRA